MVKRTSGRSRVFSLFLLLTAFPGSAMAQGVPVTTDPDLLLRERCAEVAAPDDIGRLLTLHDRLAREAQRSDDHELAWQLACVRAVLAAEGAIARASYLMPLGSSWHVGATNVAARALEDSVSGRMVTLFALLNADPTTAMKPEELTPTVEALVGRGARDPLLLRLCTELAWREHDAGRAVACARTALHSGADSTYHLLTIARERALADDTTGTDRTFSRAATAARSIADLEALDWQLRWFVTPEERNAWLQLEPAEAGTWVRTLLAERDVRDGQPRGARLVEHYHRLDHAEREFAMRITRRERGQLRVGNMNQKPTFTVDGFMGGSDGEPSPFREYAPWQTVIDDRGVAWLRFGPPVDRSVFRSTAPGRYTDRDAWKYRLDGRDLTIYFVNWGQSGLNRRFEAGVVGDHLCGLEPRRCYLGNRAWFAAEVARLPGGSATGGLGALPVELMLELKEEDRKAIAVATSRDDNSPRTEKHVWTEAQFHRLWLPSAEPAFLFALVPWGVRLEDLEKPSDAGGRTAITIEVRSYDASRDLWRDTTMTRELTLPERVPSGAWATGMLAVPATEGVASWSVAVHQGEERRGRMFSGKMSALGSGPLVLSDLVIGADRQGLEWRTATGPVVLAPLGTVNQNATVRLYYQLLSQVADDEATTTLAIYPTETTEPDADPGPALEISFATRVVEGLTEVRREIGTEQLEPGVYRLELRVRLAGGAGETVRSTTLYLTKD